MVRFVALFGRTLRQPPADAHLVSEQLALRAGLMRRLDNGLYGYLPLGYRVVRRLESLLQAELEREGFQEMWLPGLCDAAGTREVARLSRWEVQSYRDLPQAVYYLQTAVGDGPRPRGGPLRAQETRTWRGFLLAGDEETATTVYDGMLAALRRTFDRCGLTTLPAEAEEGCRFLLEHPAGERTFARCERCGYTADSAVAVSRPTEVPAGPPEEKALLATPDCATIADVAAFAGVPTSRTLKAVFYAYGEEREFVFVVIRGDRAVNERKLSRLLGGGPLQPATAEEIRAAGAEPGYASPVGLAVRRQRDGAGVLVVGDRSIEDGGNFVAGANRAGYHYTGVNYPRDFTVTLLADIAQVEAGERCPRCAGTLRIAAAVTLARCVRPSTATTEAVGAAYLDTAGKPRPLWLGEFSVGIGRLLAAVLETHHDDYGILWPEPLAPFDVHLLTLGTGDALREAAESLYNALREAGHTVLYDDRPESAGVKFADADLIGCPVRITVSKRSLKSGGVELKRRREAERHIIPLEEAVEAVTKQTERKG